MQKRYKVLIVLLLLLIMSGAITFGYQKLTQRAPDPHSPSTESPRPQEKTGLAERPTTDGQSHSTDNSQTDSLADNGQVALGSGSDRSSHTSAPQNAASSTQSTSHVSPSAPSSPLQPTPQTPPVAPSPQPSNPLQPPVTPPTQPDPPVTPPVPPVTPPVDPLQPPVQPPVDPQPPVPPATDEEKARQVLNGLKTATNSNVAQFTNDDGQIRTVLWTKGITAPRLGAGGDFTKRDETYGGNRYVTYSAAYRPEFARHGWYDTDKAPGSSAVDINLCFGAVASNQLHWWMYMNRDRVAQFLTKTRYADNLPSSQAGTLKDLRIYQNSFTDQQHSTFFTMMKTYFGNNRQGYYADPLIDMFINGHTPKANGGYNDPDWQHNFQLDSRGGFFHAVFGTRNLTRRMVPGDFADFSKEMKKAFQRGESVGIVHTTSGNYTHIITAWGLEYDVNGTLVGVYVTDSDDQESPENGMKRYGVRSVGNKAVLSNNLTNTASGARVDQISTLGLGEDKWAEYLR